MRKSPIIAALALSSLSLPAVSGSPYIGASYSVMDLDTTIFNRTSTADIGAINLTGGYKFNDFFAVEGYFSFGTSSDSFDREIGSDIISATRFEIELENGYGVNLVGSYPVSDKLDVYAKLGYASFSFDDTDGDPASADGGSFGLGANYNFTDNQAFFVEYIKFADGEYDDFDIDVEPSAINLGYKLTF